MPLAGNSMGGGITQRIARDAPERVRSATLIGSAGPKPEPSELDGYLDRGINPLLPESVEASARFEGFAVRAGEGETLTDLSGRVLLRGDRIELQGVRGRRAGHWLPVLDASLDGVSQLAANTDLPEIPHAEDAPLMLGLGPMY
ncbi:MAG: hypothetical protein ABFS41_15220, partial [Myxococcota bacterium]